MSKKRNEAAIMDCRYRMANCRAQISDNKTAIANLEGKIERLKRVRDIVHTKKEEVGTTTSNMVRSLEAVSYLMWCGRNRTSFGNREGEILTSCHMFQNDIDALEDALNNEITRLENEQYEYEGAIGQLWIVLNDLGNWLTNLLN